MIMYFNSDSDFGFAGGVLVPALLSDHLVRDVGVDCLFHLGGLTLAVALVGPRPFLAFSPFLGDCFASRSAVELSASML